MANVHTEIEKIIGTNKYGIVDVTAQSKDIQEGQAVFMFHRENGVPTFIWCQVGLDEHSLSSACCKGGEHYSYALTVTGAVLLVLEKIVSRPFH